MLGGMDRCWAVVDGVDYRTHKKAVGAGWAGLRSAV